MKELTQEEFIDRTQAVARARRIFINSGVTNNISDAFALYQEVVSETTREIFLSTAVMGHRRPGRFDKFERPKCPEDGFDMMFRNIPENREGIKVQ